MIDFQLLERLMRTARNPAEGKPLDRIDYIPTRKPRYVTHGMRNCRLFNVTATHWRVELHGNVIARIVRLDDGNALVTAYTVDEWPTRTTAQRLMSILGFDIYKRGNRLWAVFSGATEHTPLRSGQQFIIGPQGAFCTNPEIVTEQRTRILKEPSKPILTYLRSIRKLAVPLIRLGGVQAAEVAVTAAALPHDLDSDVAADLVLQVIRAGAIKRYGRWQVGRWATFNPQHSEALWLQLFEQGLKVYKDELYSAYGVYEQYTHSFKDVFKENPYGRNAPLALAA